LFGINFFTSAIHSKRALLVERSFNNHDVVSKLHRYTVLSAASYIEDAIRDLFGLDDCILRRPGLLRLGLLGRDVNGGVFASCA